MLAALLAAVLPVLVTAGIGYIWTRSGRPLDGATVTPLVADIGTPCLIFSTLAGTAIPPEAVATTAGAALAAVAGFAVAGAAVLAASGLRLRTYLPSLTFPNAGNLGLPLALYAFGQEGLGHAIVFFTITSIGNYTIGQAIAAGAVSWRGLARMPILYAAALGLAASIAHIELPRWLANTVGTIGNLTVPLMLMMLGSSLARLKVASLGRAVGLATVRLCMGALIGTAAAALFHLDGVARPVLILLSAMPVAVYNYLFALRWNNEPEEIAGLVVVSTVGAMVTLPALLSLLLG